MQDQSLITPEPAIASTATVTSPPGDNGWTRSAPPTLDVAESLQALADHLCTDLIEPELGVRLPHVMLNMQRRGRAELGHYRPVQFSTLDGAVTVGEISINPQNVLELPPIDVASTMLHELLHLWQHHHGHPGKGGYHNKEWAAAMIRCGLRPSHTGQPGGRTTGQQMDDYVIPDGPFARFWEHFVAATGKVLSWGDVKRDPTHKPRGPTRTKFVCPSCDLAAWSRASANLHCNDCGQLMGVCP